MITFIIAIKPIIIKIKNKIKKSKNCLVEVFFLKLPKR